MSPFSSGPGDSPHGADCRPRVECRTRHGHSLVCRPQTLRLAWHMALFYTPSYARRPLEAGLKTPTGPHPRAHTLPRVKTLPEQKLLRPPARRSAFPQDCSVRAGRSLTAEREAVPVSGCRAKPTDRDRERPAGRGSWPPRGPKGRCY